MENGYDISCVVEDYSIKSVEFVVRTSEMEYLVWNGEYENERYHCHLDLSGVYSQGNIYENAIRATDKFENEQGLYIGTVNISEADELNSDIGGGQDDVEKKEENDNRGDDHSDGECINNNDCNRNNEDETNNSLSDNAADSISGNDVIDSDNEDGSNDNSIVDDRDNNSNENESYNGLSDEERHGYISKTIHYQGFSDESVSMNITVNGTVSYNGKKHVSSLDGSGKTKSGDLDITVSGNVPENLEVVFKYKNNKFV